MGFKIAGTVNSSAGHVGTSPFTVAVPAVSNGDLLFLVANRNVSGVYTTPAGWTQITALQKSSAAFQPYSSLLAYKIASNEPASYDITHDDATSKAQSACIVAYDPVDAAIFDVTPVVGHSLQQYDNNTPVVPNITTVTNDAILIAFQWVSNSEITSAAGPVDFTVRLNHTPFSNRNIVIADKTQVTAGLVSPGAWQHTTSAQFGDGATAIIALKPVEANTAPTLDTPQADTEIQEGVVGTIDLGANFSDANAGDTLTFSISPNIALVTGFTFDTATGIIGYSGTQVAAAGVEHTVTATDSGGLTASDTFILTVIPPALLIGTISDTTPEINTQITVDHSNALDTLTTPNFNIASQTGTQAVIDIPDITTFILAGQAWPTINFNEPVAIPLSDGTNTDNVDLDGIQNPAGTYFGEITSIDPNGVYANDVGVAAGMFGYFFNITGNLIFFPESGTYLADDAGGSYSYKLYNGEWGTAVTNPIHARPQGTVTIDPIVPSRTGAVIAFSYAGSDLTGFQYRLDGGAWVAATSPLTLSGLTAETQYSFEITAVNNGRIGDISATTFTTDPAIDTVPNPFSFTAQTGVARSVFVTSNTITVQGVDAGVDIPISVSGGEYSVSTDGGSTWGAWTSSPTNVRLNYRVRARHLSSALYNTPINTIVTIGGVNGTFTSTTLADTVPPVITLTGGNIEWPMNTAFVDPGFSASDNADGDITDNVVVTGAVNVSVEGVNTLTYAVTDAAGNTAQTSRNVTVVNQTVTRTFAITSQNPIVNAQGTFMNFTFPIWELWTAAPEEGGTVVDSGTNFTVANGVGTVTSTVAQLNTTYLFIARSAGNLPANYIRTEGQVT